MTKEKIEILKLLANQVESEFGYRPNELHEAIAELEQSRWRKFAEEKPEHEQSVFWYRDGCTSTVQAIYSQGSWYEEGEWDESGINEIVYSAWASDLWRPLPSAPSIASEAEPTKEQ